MVHHDLAKKEDQRPDSDRTTPDAAWSITSYLLGGMAVWGGAGWLLDRWTGHNALFLPIGVIVGISAAIYLVYIRYGR